MRRIKRSTIRGLIKEELNRRVVIQENLDTIMKAISDAAKEANTDEVKAMANQLSKKGMEKFKKKLIDAGNIKDFVAKNGWPKIRDFIKGQAEKLGDSDDEGSSDDKKSAGGDSKIKGIAIELLASLGSAKEKQKKITSAQRQKANKIAGSASNDKLMNAIENIVTDPAREQLLKKFGYEAIYNKALKALETQLQPAMG